MGKFPLLENECWAFLMRKNNMNRDIEHMDAVSKKSHKGLWLDYEGTNGEGKGVGKPIHGLLELPRLKMFEPCNGKPSNFVEEDDKGMTQREERM